MTLMMPAACLKLGGIVLRQDAALFYRRDGALAAGGFDGDGSHVSGALSVVSCGVFATDN